MTDTGPRSKLSQPCNTILIAEDDPNARLWLVHFLQREGYEVSVAADGQEALELFETTPPDLVLLDALMPVMDGFETCIKLRQKPGGNQVPVLIITGLEGEDAVERAFEVGAVDYITKPIHWAVLRHRVRQILRTKTLEKLRDELTQMIVHDMKNPITIIRGYAELLNRDVNQDGWRLRAIEHILQSSKTLLDMAMMILDIGRLQESKLVLNTTKASALNILNTAKQSFALDEQHRQVTLAIDPASQDVTADLDLIQRVLVNLIANAFKHSPSNTTITLYCSISMDAPDCVMFSVADQGEGISPHEQGQIFEKYKQASLRKRGSRLDTGLGLTFCKLAAEAHGGQIEVQSTLGNGATFRLVLPLAQKLPDEVLLSQ